jgi:hypothetical protein
LQCYVQLKNKRFEEIKQELTLEKQTLDKDISQLRNALSTNTTTQTIDRRTGQVTSKANNANRKAFEQQLQIALTNKDNISKKIESLNDSITKLDLQVLDMESKSQSSNELGAIKYVSELTNTPIKSVANIFILLLIFVFDPLAITLIIATNQAFNKLKPTIGIYGEPINQKPEQPSIPDNTQERILHLEAEIERIRKAGATQKRTEAAISPLQAELNALRVKYENSIEY